MSTKRDPVEESLDAVTMYTYRFLVASKKAAPSDAKDAVQNLVVQILSRPPLRDRLADWTNHLGLFCNAAYWEYGQLARRVVAEQHRIERYGAANSRRMTAAAIDAEQEAMERLPLSEHPRWHLLTRLQAKCVQWACVDELDAREIAELLQVTPHAVRRTLVRAYNTLRGETELPVEEFSTDDTTA